jgi:hypothetical protein
LKEGGKYVVTTYPCEIEIEWLMAVLAKTSRAAKAAENKIDSSHDRIYPAHTRTKPTNMDVGCGEND